MGRDPSSTIESFTAKGRGDPLDFNLFAERYEGEQCGGEIVMLPRGFVTEPSVLPVGRDNVNGLKRSVAELLRGGERVDNHHNGLIDPVWIVRLPNGEFHIANGFHRYQATQELLNEGSLDDDELFSLIIDGTYDDLWKLRLIAAGDHGSLAPARFMVFLQDNFSNTEIGRFMTFESVLQCIGSEGDEFDAIASHYQVDKTVLAETVRLIKSAIDLMSLSDDHALLYARVSNGLAPELLNRLRLKAKRDRGELPVSLAKAFTTTELLCLPENWRIQTKIFTHCIEFGLTIQNTVKLIETIDRHLLQKEDFSVGGMVAEILDKSASIIDARKGSGNGRKGERLAPATPTLRRAVIDALNRRSYERLQNIILVGEQYALELAIGATENIDNIRAFQQLISEGLYRNVPLICSQVGSNTESERVAGRGLRLTDPLMKIIVKASFSKIFSKAGHGVDSMNGYAETVLIETVRDIAMKINEMEGVELIQLHPEIPFAHAQVVSIMGDEIMDMEAALLRDNRPELFRLRATVARLTAQLAARDLTIEELLSSIVDNTDE